MEIATVLVIVAWLVLVAMFLRYMLRPGLESDKVKKILHESKLPKPVWNDMTGDQRRDFIAQLKREYENAAARALAQKAQNMLSLREQYNADAKYAQEVQDKIRQTLSAQLEESNRKVKETGEKLEAAETKAKANLAKYTNEIQGATARLEAAQAAQVEFQEKLTAKTAEFDGAQGKIAAAQKQVSDTQAQLEAAQKQVSNTQAQLDAQTKAANMELGKVEKELDQAKKNAEINQKAVKEAQAELADAQEKFQNANEKSQQIRKQLDEVAQNKYNTVANLKKELNNSQREIQDAKERLGKEESELAQAKAELNETETILKETQIKQKALEQELGRTKSSANNTEAKLEATQKQFDEAKTNLQQAQIDKLRMGNELTKTQSSLNSSKRIAAAEREALQKEQDALQIKLNDEKKKANANIAKLKEELQKADSDAQASKKQLEAAHQEHKSFLEGKLKSAQAEVKHLKGGYDQPPLNTVKVTVDFLEKGEGRAIAEHAKHPGVIAKVKELVTKVGRKKVTTLVNQFGRSYPDLAAKRVLLYTIAVFSLAIAGGLITGGKLSSCSLTKGAQQNVLSGTQPTELRMRKKSRAIVRGAQGMGRSKNPYPNGRPTLSNVLAPGGEVAAKQIKAEREAEIATKSEIVAALQNAVTELRGEAAAIKTVLEGEQNETVEQNLEDELEKTKDKIQEVQKKLETAKSEVPREVTNEEATAIAMERQTYPEAQEVDDEDEEVEDIEETEAGFTAGSVAMTLVAMGGTAALLGAVGAALCNTRFRKQKQSNDVPNLEADDSAETNYSSHYNRLAPHGYSTRFRTKQKQM